MDPSSQCESGMLDGFETPVPAELIFECFDKPFTESVLLRRVGGDVFLGEVVVGDHGAKATGAEDQTVIMAQQHSSGCTAQRVAC